MFIEIEKKSDGSHVFQYGGQFNEGYAIIPENIQIPDTFPFVSIEVKQVEKNGKKHLEVVSMTPGERTKQPEPSSVPTYFDRIEAQVTYTAMMTDTLLEE